MAVRSPEVQVTKTGIRPRSLPEMIEMAQHMAHSQMVPKQFQGRVGDVLVAVQMGAEIGLAPMAALQNIAVINGRPSVWGDALLGLVLGHPECDDVIETFNHEKMAATCTVRRKDREPVTETFDVEDAKAAGLWKKAGPWTQYPKRMLKMRARGFALRDAFADTLRGISVAEESADLPSSGPVPALLPSDLEERPAAPLTHQLGAEPAPEPEPPTAPPETPAVELVDESGPMDGKASAIFLKELRRHFSDDEIAERFGPPPEWKAADAKALRDAITEAPTAPEECR